MTMPYVPREFAATSDLGPAASEEKESGGRGAKGGARQAMKARGGTEGGRSGMERVVGEGWV
jgi:hypothetical protein